MSSWFNYLRPLSLEQIIYVSMEREKNRRGMNAYFELFLLVFSQAFLG